MKTLQALNDGSRVIHFTAREMDALAAAVELAYQDGESVPEEYRDLGTSLYAGLARKDGEQPFPPAGWAEYQTGGGCTAYLKELGEVQMLVTSELDPCIPETREEKSFLGVYLYVDGQPSDEPIFEARGSAETVLAIGDRFGFVKDGVAYFAFPAAGSFLGVGKGEGQRKRQTLFACPMNADGTPDKEGDCEVENAEGIDFADVNALFGTSFTSNDFYGR